MRASALGTSPERASRSTRSSSMSRGLPRCSNTLSRSAFARSHEPIFVSTFARASRTSETSVASFACSARSRTSSRFAMACSSSNWPASIFCWMARNASAGEREDWRPTMAATAPKTAIASANRNQVVHFIRGRDLYSERRRGSTASRAWNSRAPFEAGRASGLGREPRPVVRVRLRAAGRSARPAHGAGKGTTAVLIDQGGGWG